MKVRMKNQKMMNKIYHVNFLTMNLKSPSVYKKNNKNFSKSSQKKTRN